MKGINNAQLSSEPKTTMVMVEISGRESNWPAVIIYVDKNGNRQEADDRIGVGSVRVEMPVNSMFFAGPMNASIRTSVDSADGVTRTYDRLSDAESYYGTLEGFIVTDPIAAGIRFTEN